MSLLQKATDMVIKNRSAHAQFIRLTYSRLNTVLNLYRPNSFLNVHTIQVRLNLQVIKIIGIT